MDADASRFTVAARDRVFRAYGVGRLRSATHRALWIASVVALVAWVSVGARGVAWAALCFVLWVALGWRGQSALRGARYGLVAGAVTFLLPLSLLRPCCRPGMSMSMSAGCCTMPGACVLLGGAVGLSLAAFLPRAREGRRIETAVGMALGAWSVALSRCSALFLGETLGLLGGLVVGVTLASAASAWITARAR